MTMTQYEVRKFNKELANHTDFSLHSWICSEDLCIDGCRLHFGHFGEPSLR